MNQYTPFEKDIDSIVGDDLVSLKTVPEGWYIEYKQEVPNAQSIAKSVSALANSYGGWIFYGIKEESKENSVAGEFIGIESDQIDAALQKIRQAVSYLISPSCHYLAKAIHGPNELLNLAPSRAIICVVVPQSIEAPHVHNKGSIYRRIADGSEPVPETDRHMIEKMFQRSKETVDLYKKWIDKDLELSDSESDAPHLRILISPNLWQIPRSDFSMNVDIAREALNNRDARISSLPFETIYSSSKGIVARQCLNNDPTKSNLTWNINYDLSGDVVIPLTWWSGTPYFLSGVLSPYNFGKDYVDLLFKSKLDEAHIVDLNFVFNVLMGIIESQRALQEKAGWSLDFYVKIKLINVWRTIPFLDIKDFITNIEKNGIPVCLTSESISPPGSHPDTFKYIKNYDNHDSTRIKVAIQTLAAFIPIAEAFGIPLSQMLQKSWRDTSDDEDNDLLTELTFAGVRAVEILNKR
ncbi:Divergent AAA domain protein [Pseudomonas sp. 24 E 13]|uniref:AlbA family DNA-binding domain-containing protein n=1 Tax=Pseudomonas sp. 24 E 13 TaxID=1844095 RepID=UPI000812338D|nr:ATP-binding protein [Pseudomonas sp. 24 E 13]CRM43377.1 Divergent AAA domain protein [Pseudomonas sp. 24 E 13]